MFIDLFNGTYCRSIVPAICLAFVLMPQLASSETTDHVPWQEWIIRADFVGVVECDRREAGIAHCTIAASWKGGRIGTNLPLYMELLVPGEFRPYPTKGHRYLVVAFLLSNEGRSRILNHPRPPDAAMLEAVDFFVPRDCEYLDVTEISDERIRVFGHEFRDYRSMARSTKTLLKNARNDPEFTLINKLAVDKFGDLWVKPIRAPESTYPWAAKLSNESMVESAMIRLLLVYATDPDRYRRDVLWVMRHGGMNGAVSFLKDPNTHKTPIRNDIGDILRRLEVYPLAMPRRILSSNG